MNALLINFQLQYSKAKAKLNTFMKKESGEINIIAIIIILAIVIALAIIFREQIKALFDMIWAAIFGSVPTVTDPY